MEAAEVPHRIRERVRERLLSAGVERAVVAPASDRAGPAWVNPLPARFDRKVYCDAADAVLEGKFACFSMGQTRIGFPPAWNRDPKTGVLAPSSLGRSLNYRDQRLVGNIKYLWEPNRHLELVTLAQAWHLSRKESYARGFRTLLLSWVEQCPYPYGPNWASSLELGIRLLNWSFAWHLFGGEKSPLFDGEDGQDFKACWLSSVFRHCDFIARFPSLYSSANNHRLGEQLGLLLATATWPKWPEALAWGDQAHDSFEHEALLQNAGDGVNREQGIWYHHEVVDMMLVAGLVMRACGRDFSRLYWERLEAMLTFVASVMDCGGNVPAFGDSDDAVMVRLSPDKDVSVYESQLATGAVLFRRSDFKMKARLFDDKSRWLLGDSAESEFAALPAVVLHTPPRQAFPDGGYFILGTEFESSREVRVVADAGSLGYLNIAAHGHADALSFTLSVGGNEVLIDPGTYAYHTDTVWRDYFRGTAAHNTVRVDQLDQSVSGGNFMWMRHARARCEHFDGTGPLQLLVASHDGYTRLTDPVVHRRHLTFDRVSRLLKVEDMIEANGRHHLEMFWHVSERCSVHLRDRYAVLESSVARVILRWPDGARCRLGYGEESPPLGWVSRRFDSKVQSCALVVTCESSGRWSGVSEFQIEMLKDVTNDS